MRFSRIGFLPCLIAITVAVFALNITSYAQFSVSVSAPSNSMTVPTGSFNVTATVSNAPAALSKVVFYKNDVPYKTVYGTSTTPSITENLGQDTYTYRARAYASNGATVESADYALTVRVPSGKMFRMGSSINGVSTSGPNSGVDHTTQIQDALNYISSSAVGGGTLYFPCNSGLSIYNISSTIVVPSNVTIQSESSEEGIYNGRCRFYWINQFPNPGGCANKLPDNPQAMFRIEGNKARIRFKDLWIVSRVLGLDCGDNGTWEQIRDQMSTGILFDAESSGEISDVILENVSITGFTYGIKAVGNSISDVKMRGVRPVFNHRQLYIDATYAYDWDVQNFNLGGMTTNQGAIEIINAGAPSGYTGENKKIKFLELNCNGDFGRTSAFCTRILKHGGLYFKGLHTEGTAKSIVVEDIGSAVNSEPIVFEYSSLVAEVNDDSAKLYLIGNGLAAAPDIVSAQTTNHPDKARFEFIGAGVNSTLVDCGDIHGDRTDTHVNESPEIDPYDAVTWDDWRMQFTHSERNRESFFAKLSNGVYYPKAHTVCPSGVSGLSNINDVSGEHFNTGVIPADEEVPYTTTNKFSCTASASTCHSLLQALLNSSTDVGTVQIVGPVTVDQTVTIPTGKQLVGGKNTLGQDGELILSLSTNPSNLVDLLQINMNSFVPPSCPPVSPPCPRQALRVSSITVRNLKLSTNQRNTSGIAIVGLPYTDVTGVSSDMHFSGLTVTGFGKGLDVRRYGATTHPMVDGISWKNIKFVDNLISGSVLPSNISNWNIINLAMESNSSGAVGWHHANTGAMFQNVTCKGTSTYKMDHCFKLEIAGIYLTGLKKTDYVTNDVTFFDNWKMFTKQYYTPIFSNTVLRDNDFTGSGTSDGGLNFRGKAVVTSMNNRYKEFKVYVNADDKGQYSRVTYCGDTFQSGTFTGLQASEDNLYVGVQTPALIQCGNNSSTPRPKPWADVINLWDSTASVSGDDTPLVGNFYDNTLEDIAVYRRTSQSKFIISKVDGSARQSIDWGLPGDIPLVGKFLPGYRSQLVAWREVSGSNSQVWVYNPQTATYFSTTFGLSGDKPFVGNFLDESGSVTGNMDEYAVYRPSTGAIWIENPRTPTTANATFTLTSGISTPIQVGDFLGLGFDQVAQYNAGTWTIVNPRTSAKYTATLGDSNDVPVTGKFLSGGCTQIGVWDEATEQITVKDAVVTNVATSVTTSNCGTRTSTMYWGSNNNSPSGSNYETINVSTTECTTGGNCIDDILLNINTSGSSLDRPVAYRPTNGVFPYSKAKGQWWIHDVF